jgi:hypothetical protein
MRPGNSSLHCYIWARPAFFVFIAPQDVSSSTATDSRFELKTASLIAAVEVDRDSQQRQIVQAAEAGQQCGCVRIVQAERIAESKWTQPSLPALVASRDLVQALLQP